jgi:hypothetical protein
MADDSCAAALFSSPEGARAAERLAAALASLPAAAGSLLQEVRITQDGRGVALRQVHEEGERVAAALRTAAPAFASHDALTKAELVLLTHTFQLPPGHAGGGDCSLLTLKTLAMLKTNASKGQPTPPAEATLRAVFGDVTVIMRGGFATALAVDGRFLQSAEAAAYRGAANLRLRAQVPLALRACFAARWPGGFLGLRRAAGALLGAAAGEWLEPLAALMLTARCAPARLSIDLLLSRTFQGEAHEAAGAFDAAAAQYALNVEALEATQGASYDDDDAEEHFADDAGIYASHARWRLCEQLGFQALALKRGGRFTRAEAA